MSIKHHSRLSWHHQVCQLNFICTGGQHRGNPESKIVNTNVQRTVSHNPRDGGGASAVPSDELLALSRRS